MNRVPQRGSLQWKKDERRRRRIVRRYFSLEDFKRDTRLSDYKEEFIRYRTRQRNHAMMFFYGQINESLKKKESIHIFPA